MHKRDFELPTKFLELADKQNKDDILQASLYLLDKLLMTVDPEEFFHAIEYIQKNLGFTVANYQADHGITYIRGEHYDPSELKGGN